MGKSCYGVKGIQPLFVFKEGSLPMHLMLCMVYGGSSRPYRGRFNTTIYQVWMLLSNPFSISWLTISSRLFIYIRVTIVCINIY
ncbi:uncharacterized protein F4807DRAFT_437360 [Annulohypoxylon truncatum]|uniref:uncharacterized protein n=1 Tax=Annulohypoxylon truncatum TaxID=327061 RepID=UPI0020080AB4|nr:uncharacterized protein F4807DRAFT_437360 [Annulohypoxylon truncatum]KAI1206815.1 hypothetical protein F4807DRAFT_437360 [Annulohypoxylon truncatum]